ncbi:MAG: hypothetical protein WDA21_00870 [Bacilli bacterium]
MAKKKPDIVTDIKLITKKDIENMLKYIDKGFDLPRSEKILSYIKQSKKHVNPDRIKEYQEIIESYLIDKDEISNNIIEGVVIGMSILSDGEGSNKQRCVNIVKVLESMDFTTDEIYEACNIIVAYHKNGSKLQEYWNGYLPGIKKFVVGSCNSVKFYLKERLNKIKNNQFQRKL